MRSIAVLVVEQELRERLGQLGLADAGRAEEQERADRAVRVLQPGTRAAHSIRDRAQRLVLPDTRLRSASPFAAASRARLPSSCRRECPSSARRRRDVFAHDFETSAVAFRSFASLGCLGDLLFRARMSP
jgi:hypothetical protein